MKYSIVLICFFLFQVYTYAQIDNSRGFSTPIPATENKPNLNSPFSTPAKKPSLSNNDNFFSREDAKKPLSESKEKNFDMSTDNGLMTKKFDYKPSWLTKDKEVREEYYKGQLLGTFGTDSKTVEILCRDHQYVDGDKVQIIVNDIVIVQSVNLRSDFQSFIVDLKEGRNVIEFLALNQGTSGPNTAHFKVYDQANNLLTENVWNLATGVKASLVVIQKEKSF